AAGSIPYILQVLLGIRADGFNRRLYIRQPWLPLSIGEVWIKRLRVCDAELCLHFSRTPRGIETKVDNLEGDLDIQIESDHATPLKHPDQEAEKVPTTPPARMAQKAGDRDGVP